MVRVHADLGRFYYVDPVRIQTQLDHTAIVTTFIMTKYVQNKIKRSGWTGSTLPQSS